MKNNKSNVTSLVEHARKNQQQEGKTHHDVVVNYSMYTPYVMIVQDHLTNLRLTYGDQVVKEAVQLMGLDSKKEVA